MKASTLLSEYLKTDTIRASGPTHFTIKDYEIAEFKDEKTGKLVKKLALVVGDDQPQILLNKENNRTLIEAFGDETDAWIGKTMEVYFDPKVMFGGKKVGGLRVRVPDQTMAT